MKISEIKSEQGSITIEADVIDVSGVRNISKFNKQLKVATATLMDESGQIELSLWNQDIEKVKKGDKIKLTNGYAKEFQGKMQITPGKFGKLEVIGKADVQSEIRTNFQEPKEQPQEDVSDYDSDEDDEW